MVACHRAKRVGPTAATPQPDAGTPVVATRAPPGPPVWARQVTRQPERPPQVSGAQIVICWKGTPAPWVSARARQRSLDDARKLAEEVAAKARAGADFAALAVKYSDWPFADQKIATGYGGRLGLITKGMPGQPEAFNRLFTLKVGEVSEPVSGAYGVYVFKRLPAIHLGEILISHEGAGKMHAPRSEAEARQLAQKIEGELASGKSFADEAFAYSDDIGTAGSGGDLGAFEKEDRIPEDMRGPAGRLAVGQTSPPFETSAGLVILKRLE
jgi:PPIC-type PPIASE domain